MVFTKNKLYFFLFIIFASHLNPLIAQSPDCSPSTPTNLAVNSSCSFQTFTNDENGTAQTTNASCALGYGTAYEDVWYSVTGTGDTITITLNGSNTNTILAAFTGCGTGEIAGACTQIDAGATGSISFLSTNATIYYIQIQRRSGNNQNTDQTGSVCAVIVPLMGNDEPCSATPLITDIYCNALTFTNVTATESTVPSDPGCANWATGTAADVWFKFVAPLSGLFNIETGALMMNNSGMAIYTSPTNDCSDLVLFACDDASGQGSMSLINGVNLPPGETVWIRIWENANDNNGTFNLCVYETSICAGQPNNNDFCESPATLNYCPPCSFSASTAASYNVDDPVSMDSNTDSTGFGCGILHNNSWYSFTAEHVSDTFSIISLSNCVDTAHGIQAHIYEVTHDTNGCCTAFSSVSSCFGDITGSSIPLDVIATGLTVGNTYVLMIDGYAGNNCDFTIDGWSGTGILPVELVEFAGTTFPDKNVLSWKTVSEKDNDYFILNRSFDGVNYDAIKTIAGSGTSLQALSYLATDLEIRSGIVYYQIEQIDFNGASEKSEVIALNRKLTQSGLISIYPNPAETYFTVEVNVTCEQGGTLSLENLAGQIISEHTIENQGMYILQFDTVDIQQGMYIIRYTDVTTSTTHKIILK